LPVDQKDVEFAVLGQYLVGTPKGRLNRLEKHLRG
jgi:hypothetical protein